MTYRNKPNLACPDVTDHS